ncbi:MAG: hypothetical protein EA362_12985 [Saprospirales bacterium]|nr:MAG: hypothetical protein EA362_12985 [Saprospirales bacterium]
MLLATILISCENMLESELKCSTPHDKIEGTYFFYSDRDTSSYHINIVRNGDTIITSGLVGYGFWFPVAPLSGVIDGCQITINSYENVKRPGLPSPGGSPRNYYESMSGFGEYFPDQDSIVLFIEYQRTVSFQTHFRDYIYLEKVN